VAYASDSDFKAGFQVESRHEGSLVVSIMKEKQPPAFTQYISHNLTKFQGHHSPHFCPVGAYEFQHAYTSMKKHTNSGRQQSAVHVPSELTK
jgi:hypothetical protein